MVPENVLALLQNARDDNGGLLFGMGTTVPADTTAGWMKGAKFLDTNGTTVSLWYTNIGTQASCDFNLDTTAA